MNFKSLSPLLMIFFLVSCSPVSTEWNNEKVTNDNVSMIGSHKVAMESLSISSHAWKALDYDKSKNSCEWGFKVDVRCNEHPDFPMSEDGIRDVLFIQEIKYSLYDEDDFHLTTLILKNESLGFGTTKTFQASQTSDLSLIKRAAKGKLNIIAGSFLDYVTE